VSTPSYEDVRSRIEEGDISGEAESERDESQKALIDQWLTSRQSLKEGAEAAPPPQPPTPGEEAGEEEIAEEPAPEPPVEADQGEEEAPPESPERAAESASMEELVARAAAEPAAGEPASAKKPPRPTPEEREPELSPEEFRGPVTKTFARLCLAQNKVEHAAAIVRRLQEKAGDDPEVQALHQEVKQRLAGG
jgi:hypothetical protein